MALEKIEISLVFLLFAGLWVRIGWCVTHRKAKPFFASRFLQSRSDLFRFRLQLGCWILAGVHVAALIPILLK